MSSAPLQDNLPYRPSHGGANRQDQNSELLFYQGIYYHNCCKEGHYSTSYTKPFVGRTQRETNGRAINELQRGYQQYFYGPSPALGPPIVPVVLATVVASEKREKKEQKD